MKFIVFNGSPAGESSNTNVIAEAFLRGARRAGAETENVFLIEKNIGHCKGCFACWYRTPGVCVMQDDMTELLRKYSTADVVCYASPVYTWNVTAALKNFVDRIVPLKSPRMISTDEHFDLADSKPKTQRFVVISNSGFPGDNNFEIIKAVFSPCNPSLEIYRNCGRILRSEDQRIKAKVTEYLEAVDQAGYEMATQDQVTENTLEKLAMPLMSIPEYIQYLGM